MFCWNSIVSISESSRHLQPFYIQLRKIIRSANPNAMPIGERCLPLMKSLIIDSIYTEYCTRVRNKYIPGMWYNETYWYNYQQFSLNTFWSLQPPRTWLNTIQSSSDPTKRERQSYLWQSVSIMKKQVSNKHMSCE